MQQHTHGRMTRTISRHATPPSTHSFKLTCEHIGRERISLDRDRVRFQKYTHQRETYNIYMSPSATQRRLYFVLHIYYYRTQYKFTCPLYRSNVWQDNMCVARHSHPQLLRRLTWPAQCDRLNRDHRGRSRIENAHLAFSEIIYNVAWRIPFWNQNKQRSLSRLGKNLSEYAHRSKATSLANP